MALKAESKDSDCVALAAMYEWRVLTCFNWQETGLNGDTAGQLTGQHVPVWKLATCQSHSVLFGQTFLQGVKSTLDELVKGLCALIHCGRSWTVAQKVLELHPRQRY
eukprot:scpid65988/ scgid12847/ 